MIGSIQELNMNEHILLAYKFDGNGGGTPLTEEHVSKHTKNHELSWVHLDADHPNTVSWLEEEIAYLDPFIINALLEEGTRPRVVQINEGVLLILRGVNLNENADPEDMVSIRLWIDKHRIISVRRRKMKAVVDMEDKIKAGKGPKNAGDFVCMLALRLFERIEPVLSALDEATDDIEEKVLEEADTSLREGIIDVRKQAIMFRRYMAPQRDAIGSLRMTDLSWLDEIHKRNLQEAYHHLMRYVEDLDAVRERAQIVKDELS